MRKSFKGFPLFEEIQDTALRARNRAVIMANIVEDNLTKGKRVTPNGAALLLGYFESIPQDERQTSYLIFEQQLKERGFSV